MVRVIALRVIALRAIEIGARQYFDRQAFRSFLLAFLLSYCRCRTLVCVRSAEASAIVRAPASTVAK